MGDIGRAFSPQDWLSQRHFHHSQFTRAQLAQAVQETNLVVVVIIPAKEVGATIAGVLDITVAPFVQDKIVAEVVVLDALSVDGTGAIAAAHGARVVQQDDIATQYGRCQGKGDALWRGLQVTGGHVIAFLDGDTSDPDPAHLLGILGPLILYPNIQMVRGTFARPFQSRDGKITADEGGRVTELIARPLLNLHYPELAGFQQPLAGEFAGRRDLFERLPFPVGYGVEIATLVDSLGLVGLDALAQVDLGTRQNNHKALRDLTSMAYVVLCALEQRLQRGTNIPSRIFLPWKADFHPVPTAERPPISTITESIISEKETSNGTANGVDAQLHYPPFVAVPGVFNVRDIGNYDAAPTCSVRSHLVYRSAELNKMTKEGGEVLKALGITKIYDLRSLPELEGAKAKADKLHASNGNGHHSLDAEHDIYWEPEYAHLTAAGTGVERVFAPVFPNEDYSPAALAERFSAYASHGTEGFTKAYRLILTRGVETFRNILLHFAKPNPAPILIHCTAGKDRTGIAVMLLMLIAGCSASTVAYEYALTQDGLHDWRPATVARLMQDPALQGNQEGVENMVSARAENMLAVIKMLENTWGDVHGYVKEVLGLDEETVSKVKAALVIVSE